MNKPDHKFNEDLNGYCYDCGVDQFDLNHNVLREMHKDQAPIPSPFMQPTLPADPLERDFILELNDLCAKHGHKHYFIFFECEDPTNKTMKMWKGFSNMISEFMVQSLENITKSMRLVWDNQFKK